MFKTFRLPGVLLLSLVMIGCAAAPAVTDLPQPSTATPLPPTATPKPITFGKVDVGGYKLDLSCIGEGTPTIIFENGLNSDRYGWASVINGFEAPLPTRLCSYSRAGMGLSQPPLITPRTSLDMVHDLHALLENAHIPDPYVLVGASMGGNNAIVYMQEYPDEVAGIILVDATHPMVTERFLAVTPEQTPSEDPYITEMRDFFENRFEKPDDNQEAMDLTLSFAQVDLDSFPNDFPLIVLSQSPSAMSCDVPKEYCDSLSQVWQDLQVDFASRSSKSVHLQSEHSGHDIANEDPALVQEAINQILQMLP